MNRDVCMVLKPFLWLYYCLIALPLFAVVTVLASLVTIIGTLLGGGRWAAYYPGKIWSRVALILALCPVEVNGKEHILRDHGPYVVIANHQSMFDIFVMYGYIGLNFKWVMKQEIRKMWFIGRACQDAGFIFVDDTRKSSIHETMEAAKKVLSDGVSIFIFPEGSRTFTGEMGRFKKGAFLMAEALDAPLLPVTIDGAFEVLKRGHRIPHPHKIRLTIHPEIHIRDLGEPPRSTLIALDRARQAVASALPKE